MLVKSIGLISQGQLDQLADSLGNNKQLPNHLAVNESNSSKVSYATVYYGTTTTYTQTDSQFIGKAIAADKLLLEEQDPNIIYGKASNTIAKGNPVIVEADGDFAKAESVTENFSQGTAGDITEAYKHGCITYDPDEDKYIYLYKGWSADSGK